MHQQTDRSQSAQKDAGRARRSHGRSAPVCLVHVARENLFDPDEPGGLQIDDLGHFRLANLTVALRICQHLVRDDALDSFFHVFGQTVALHAGELRRLLGLG
jgi:hypothetical protein